MPNFTKIPEEFREEYKRKFTLTDNKKIEKRAEEDPVIFAFYYLGQTMRLHQAYIIYRILTSKPKTKELGQRIAMCISRQLGKSIAFCVFALWSCWYNKYPATMFENTNIYITSRDDNAAKDVIKKIKKVMHLGDMQMKKYGQGDGFFNGSLKQPTNAYEVTFLNDSYIGSFPPTLTALGKSASWFFVDEAHRLNCTDTDPETFFDTASSIVSETRGGICLSSSPQGTTGFFFRAIDPDDQYPENEYDSMWWSHEIWDEDTPDCIAHKAYVESERIRLIAAGRFKMWQQEHLAMFTVTEEAFFDHKDVDKGVKDTPQLYEWKETPCSVAYDYGMKNSRTVITVRTKLKDKETKKEEIIQLFQHRCEAGFDNNKLHDEDWEHSTQRLKKRYNLSLGIFADDCPNGNDHNNWMKEHSGIPVILYNFRSDQMSKRDGLNRNCVAYAYRARLKDGVLKIPKWNTQQQYEMKIVQEIEQKVLITIKAPQGYLCDTFDSDMMACIPLLDMQGGFDFEFDVPKGEKEFDYQDKNNPKYDGFKALTDEECKQMIKDANELDEGMR